MSTDNITITITEHHKRYISELYHTRYNIVDEALEIMDTCKGRLDDPKVKAINDRALASYKAAWDEIHVIDDVIMSLGWYIVSPDEIIWWGNPLRVATLKALIRDHERNDSEDCKAVFRAVLSAFSIVYYYAPDGIAIRLTIY